MAASTNVRTQLISQSVTPVSADAVLGRFDGRLNRLVASHVVFVPSTEMNPLASNWLDFNPTPMAQWIKIRCLIMMAAAYASCRGTMVPWCVYRRHSLAIAAATGAHGTGWYWILYEGAAVRQVPMPESCPYKLSFSQWIKQARSARTLHRVWELLTDQPVPMAWDSEAEEDSADEDEGEETRRKRQRKDAEEGGEPGEPERRRKKKKKKAASAKGPITDRDLRKDVEKWSEINEMFDSTFVENLLRATLGDSRCGVSDDDVTGAFEPRIAVLQKIRLIGPDPGSANETNELRRHMNAGGLMGCFLPLDPANAWFINARHLRPDTMREYYPHFRRPSVDPLSTEFIDFVRLNGLEPEPAMILYRNGVAPIVPEPRLRLHRFVEVFAARFKSSGYDSVLAEFLMTWPFYLNPSNAHLGHTLQETVRYAGDAHMGVGRSWTVGYVDGAAEPDPVDGSFYADPLVCSVRFCKRAFDLGLGGGDTFGVLMQLFLIFCGAIHKSDHSSWPVLVGPTGVGKSWTMKEAAKLVPRSGVQCVSSHSEKAYEVNADGAGDITYIDEFDASRFGFNPSQRITADGVIRAARGSETLITGGSQSMHLQRQSGVTITRVRNFFNSETGDARQITSVNESYGVEYGGTNAPVRLAAPQIVSRATIIEIPGNTPGDELQATRSMAERVIQPRARLAGLQDAMHRLCHRDFTVAYFYQIMVMGGAAPRPYMDGCSAYWGAVIRLMSRSWHPPVSARESQRIQERVSTTAILRAVQTYFDYVADPGADGSVEQLVRNLPYFCAARPGDLLYVATMPGDYPGFSILTTRVLQSLYRLFFRTVDVTVAASLVTTENGYFVVSNVPVGGAPDERRSADAWIQTVGERVHRELRAPSTQTHAILEIVARLSSNLVSFGGGHYPIICMQDGFLAMAIVAIHVYGLQSRTEIISSLLEVLVPPTDKTHVMVGFSEGEFGKVTELRVPMRAQPINAASDEQTRRAQRLGQTLRTLVRSRGTSIGNVREAKRIAALAQGVQQIQALANLRVQEEALTRDTAAVKAQEMKIMSLYLTWPAVFAAQLRRVAANEPLSQVMVDGVPDAGPVVVRRGQRDGLVRAQSDAMEAAEDAAGMTALMEPGNSRSSAAAAEEAPAESDEMEPIPTLLEISYAHLRGLGMPDSWITRSAAYYPNECLLIDRVRNLRRALAAFRRDRSDGAMGQVSEAFELWRGTRMSLYLANSPFSQRWAEHLSAGDADGANLLMQFESAHTGPVSPVRAAPDPVFDSNSDSDMESL